MLLFEGEQLRRVAMHASLGQLTAGIATCWWCAAARPARLRPVPLT